MIKAVSERNDSLLMNNNYSFFSLWVSPSNAKLFDWCQFQIDWLSSVSNKLTGRSFKYGVSDALSGAEFGHEESEDGAGSRVSIVEESLNFSNLLTTT